MLEAVPFVIRRFLRLVGAEAGIVAEAVEIDAVRAGMAEDAVEDDADARFVSGFAERGEFFIRPQHGIDAEIVRRAVAVVARAFKDRVEVNGRNPQFFEVRQLFPDAGDVAAEEIVIDDVPFAFALAVIRHVVPVAVDDGALLAVKAARRAVAVTEAVRENLVDHGVLEPVRCMGVLVVDRDLIGRRHVVVDGPCPAELVAVVAVIDGLAAVVDDEIVPEQTALRRQIEDGRENTAVGRHGHEGFTDIALPEADPGPAFRRITACRLKAQDKTAPGRDGTETGTVVKLAGIVIKS